MDMIKDAPKNLQEFQHELQDSEAVLKHRQVVVVSYGTRLLKFNRDVALERTGKVFIKRIDTRSIRPIVIDVLLEVRIFS